ncbi:MAG: DUF4411 family protein [Candidatus Zixiibacteriota bacterium]
MIDELSYILDANVFIEAARRYYAFDLAPKFWKSLVNYADERQIRSIDRVKKELERGNDDLARWVKQEFDAAFASTDEEEIIQSYREIMAWVYNQNQFSDAAKSEFAKGADGWLIAYARVKGCLVVTHEELAPDVKRKVPIPNVCQAFGVNCTDTFKMLRSLGVRFD